MMIFKRMRAFNTECKQPEGRCRYLISVTRCNFGEIAIFPSGEILARDAAHGSVLTPKIIRHEDHQLVHFFSEEGHRMISLRLQFTPQSGTGAWRFISSVSLCYWGGEKGSCRVTYAGEKSHEALLDQGDQHFLDGVEKPKVDAASNYQYLQENFERFAKQGGKFQVLSVNGVKIQEFGTLDEAVAWARLNP